MRLPGAPSSDTCKIATLDSWLSVPNADSSDTPISLGSAAVRPEASEPDQSAALVGRTRVRDRIAEQRALELRVDHLKRSPTLVSIRPWKHRCSAGPKLELVRSFASHWAGTTTELLDVLDTFTVPVSEWGRKLSLHEDQLARLARADLERNLQSAVLDQERLHRASPGTTQDTATSNLLPFVSDATLLKTLDSPNSATSGTEASTFATLTAQTRPSEARDRAARQRLVAERLQCLSASETLMKVRPCLRCQVSD
ncbi:hypothetical protein MRB53_039202 [Persea americana]|nr:hypothetical protein MRB53_039202 [Persea americana]